MTQKICKKCGRIIIENFEKWLWESTDKYIECPYCGEVEKVKW